MRYIRHTAPGTKTSIGDTRGAVYLAYSLIEKHLLAEGVHQRVADILTWLERNLPRPWKWSRSTRPSAMHVGLSWLKDTAHEHVKALRELAEALRSAGYVVEEHVSNRPGYIVYEDEWQVVAEPFRGSR